MAVGARRVTPKRPPTQNGATPLLVGKAGYEVVGQVPNEYGAIVATVNGDTQFDIELARR